MSSLNMTVNVAQSQTMEVNKKSKTSGFRIPFWPVKKQKHTLNVTASNHNSSVHHKLNHSLNMSSFTKHRKKLSAKLKEHHSSGHQLNLHGGTENGLNTTLPHTAPITVSNLPVIVEHVSAENLESVDNSKMNITKTSSSVNKSFIASLPWARKRSK